MSDPPSGTDSVGSSVVFQELTAQSELPPSTGLSPERFRRGLQQTFRALRHRNYRLFVTGQIVSLVGTWMQNVALSWLVYRLTHSEFLLGTTWFCTQLPVFALGPLGGLASDRYSRHRLVILTQILSMIQALLLAGLTLSGKVEVWQVLILASILGCINAFDMPARQSLVVELAGKDDLLNAISINSAIFNGARVIGPAVAGVVVSLLGEGMCFLLNGLSFIAVIACLLSMRIPPHVRASTDSPWQHLVQGFRYAYHHTIVRSLLLMMAASTISGMPALVLMPFFADAIFQKGSQGLGALMGAMGVGAVIGTLVLAGRTQTAGLNRVILLSSASMGICFVIFAFSPWFLLSLAIMPLIGFSVMRQMASANTMIQCTIPDQYRGRIMALYSMTVVGLGPLDSLAAGALAHSQGARVTVCLGGVLALAATAVFALRMPAMARAAEHS